jgi:hypothetical protein
MVLMAAACQASTLSPKASAPTPEGVALKPGDVAGLQMCSASGDVNAVLQDERSSDPTGYDLNATEWEQWRRQGASDAYVAVYGRTAADCGTMSGSGTGEPSGGLIVGLTVKFNTEAVAARNYSLESTLLGFGPGDIKFIKLVGGGVTTGSDTGLGPLSVIGTGSVIGTTYYFAFWQNRTFDSFLMAYDLTTSDARGAVDDVNQRIH